MVDLYLFIMSIDVIFHFAIWLGVALFGLYNVYRFGRNIDKSEIFYGDFVNGWNITGRSKDISDFEWQTWKTIAFKLLPWICAHSILSNFFCYKITSLKIWHIILPFLFILIHCGCFALGVMLLQPIVYYFLVKRNSKTRWIWIWSSIFLLVFNHIKEKYLEDDYYFQIMDMDETKFYMVSAATFWIQLRCISFSLEILTRKKYFKNYNALDLLSYCFYLPLLFLGPVILYKEFYHSLHYNSRLQLKNRIFSLIINIGRYSFWFLFIELSTQYIYFNAMQYNISVINIMPDWCLYGGGLWMGLYFYLKYLVTYGIASSLAAFDSIVPESPPLCVVRVHLYSQMWKYFDVGLHKFLIRYIYKPTMDVFTNIKIKSLIQKSFSSCLCFLFVLFWHGTNSFIFIWTFFNYLGIITENIGNEISQTSIYLNFENSYLKSDESKKRFKAIFSTPILAISAISNFYFFAGTDVGNIYVKRVIEQSFINFLAMFICIYSCCRVSQSLSTVKARKIRL